jgi:TnpA family transposase
MPVGFLNKTLQVQLSSFPETINYNDLITYFTLTDQDLRAVPARSSAINRLGFAVQLCALRFMGFFIKNMSVVPEIVIEFLKEQLALNQTLDIRYYAERRQTRTDHIKAIEKHLGFRPTDSAYKKSLQAWLLNRALEHDRPLLLFQFTAEKMKQDKRTRYGLWKMEKLISNAREQAKQAIHDSLKPYLNQDQKDALDKLLTVENDQITELNWLSRKATSHSPENILEVLWRIRRLRELGADLWDLSHLNRNRVRHLAQLGKRSTNQALKRSKVERRYPILIACLSELLHECTDESIEVFDLCISESYRRSRNQYKEYRKKMDKLINAHNVVLQHIARLVVNHSIPDVELRQIILQDVPEEKLREIIEDPKGIIRPLDGNHLDYFVRRFNYIRKFSPHFLDTLKFHCHPNANDLFDGVQLLKIMNNTGSRTIPDDAPMSFVASSWQDYIIGGNDKLNRRYYEMAVLWELRNTLRSGEVWLENSRRYKDPESYLIPRNQWPSLKKEAEQLLKFPTKNRDRIQCRCRELVECYENLNQLLPLDKSVKIEKGNVVVSPTEAEAEPQSVTKLKTAITERLPRIHLTDLLIEVDRWMGFMKKFSHAGGQDTIADDINVYIYASILAQATNLGLHRMNSVADLSYQRLVWCTNWYLRDETLDKAAGAIINTHHDHWLTRFWGNGSFSSSDGQRFPVAIKTNTARALPKYFGYGRGLTHYSWTSDQFSHYGTKVIPTTVREAVYALDAILDNETDLSIERHTTDTAGYTEIIFALFDLLGLRFEPRIKDLGDQRIYTVSDLADLKNLVKLDVHRINMDLIERHWEDMVRVAASLKMGWVTASLLISKYQSAQRQSGLVKALQEYGRLIKSIGILRYVTNEAHRREIGLQLNKGEAMNNLRLFILFAREGKIFKRTLEDQQHQAKCVNLVTNAIVYWNTIYMGKVIEQLESEGWDIIAEDLQHISPARFEHINPYGQLKFDLEDKLNGELRPLRNQKKT